MLRAWPFVLMALIATGCDRVQLLAPTSSTISVSAPTRILPTGGSTEVTAFVLEQAGTPVQNGTVVRFTTTLGRVDPQEAQTRNGLAVTTFFAGSSSGVSQIRATSGGAGGSTTTGTGTTATTTTTNLVEITIGAAAAARVSLTATPSSVSSSGGTSQVTATVADTAGNALPGVLVTFSTDAGSLSSSSATTDSGGRATVSVTTNRASKVTVRVGAGTGTNAITAEVTIGANVQGTVTLTCSGIAAAAATCSQLPGAAVTFTAIRTVTTGAAPITSARLDFGEGPSVALGSLASSATVNHVYQGAGTYTATLSATDANGETSVASVTVIVTARPQLIVTLAATPGTSVLTVGNTTSFTATVTPATGGGDLVESYTWDFGDDSDDAVTSGNITSHVYRTNGPKIATVTVRTTDGRTATARTEFIISGI